MKKYLILAAAALTAICCTETKRPEPQLIISLSDFPELEHVHNMQGGAVYGDLFFSLQAKPVSARVPSDAAVSASSSEEKLSSFTV